MSEPKYQDPMDRPAQPGRPELVWPRGTCGMEGCTEEAFAYDKDPATGVMLCRSHRTWSWLGTWEANGWSLRITPTADHTWWSVWGQRLNEVAYDEEIQNWDINLVIRELRRGTNKKIEIVLPQPEHILALADARLNKELARLKRVVASWEALGNAGQRPGR